MELRGKNRGNRFSNVNPLYSTIKNNSASNTTVVSKPTGSIDVVHSKQGTSPQHGKRLTPAQIQERRSKGLCYNCDEAWSIHHKCTSKHLFFIDGETDESTDVSDTASAPVPSNISAPAMPPEVAISLHALSGNVSYQTLLLKGKVKNMVITMLVDTGSTHNFLDSNAAKSLGCICSETPKHQVMVAGGGHHTCDKVCQNFNWDLNGIPLRYPFVAFGRMRLSPGSAMVEDNWAYNYGFLQIRIEI